MDHRASYAKGVGHFGEAQCEATRWQGSNAFDTRLRRISWPWIGSRRRMSQGLSGTGEGVGEDLAEFVGGQRSVTVGHGRF